MTPRLKLSLAGASFLALNGVTLFTIDNQFNIFDSLRDISLWGGQFFTQSESLNLNNSSNKLTLDSKTKEDSTEIQLGNSTPFNAKLDTQNADLNIQSLKSELEKLTPTDKSATDNISGVFKEIHKESKIESIEGKISAEYLSLRDKHLSAVSADQIKHLEEFNKTKSQVESWSKSRDKFASATALTKSQRTSLQKVYEFYDALKIERDKLKDELKKHSDLPEEVLKAQKSGVPSAETIKDSLNKMDWQKDKIKVQKNHQSTHFFDSRGWGNWNSNPYKWFFRNEKEWRNSVSQSNKNALAVHKLEQQINRYKSMTLIAWGPRVQRHIQEDTKKLNQIKTKMHSHIELQVAHKLLKYMNSPELS
ncbi:hypothetical protein OVS_01775 [Mycoplasma ovis str. Michigan]|uniref:Uncharacterized protein n=1 Tax=Mycoplasma ovis str. Michigan TaxID=1415773 RepID=A0ABM5P1H0_9MOLU|nr:hypothetical protein [Mycoplasma ovis]AHC40240.1 hypothetical protein OVS_01775 [Mycoplasma ovis str. Michigan]